tara:strand:- start:3088 stop:3363 length:276 start_codon:yes stop_codon:yes gene_type:complete
VGVLFSFFLSLNTFIKSIKGTREGQTEDKRNEQRTRQGHKDRQTERQTTNQPNNQTPTKKTRKHPNKISENVRGGLFLDLFFYDGLSSYDV